MIRNFIILILSLLFSQVIRAQQLQSRWTYGGKNDSEVSIDYKVMKPDSSTGKLLYPIIEFYRNGTKRLVATSLSKSTFKLDGTCVYFYPNGFRESIVSYKDGNVDGNVVEYYPNGKMYANENVNTNRVLLIQCRDSSGKVLAENGNGNWIKFDENFTKIIGEGAVKDSLETGVWHGKINDTVKYTCIYEKGIIKSSGTFGKSGVEYVYTTVQVQPYFQKGTAAFYDFVLDNLKYPETDAEGNVLVGFIVEKDGTLTHIKALSAPNRDFGKEAVRIMKLSPKWVAGNQYGMPVRVQYSLTIPFRIKGAVNQ